MSEQKAAENREVVIEAKNLGVKFHTGNRTDDYKSFALRFIKREKDPNAGEAFWPLRDLSFKGYKGEILGIIGSNGSGKTTVCKMLSGILEKDEGELTVNGRVSALFSMGMGFDKELTGRENAYLNGMMLGISKDRINEFIDDIHEFSGLGKFLDRPTKTYSSGMKARLGFSVAAHLEPEILILDEALNTGDASFGQRAADRRGPQIYGCGATTVMVAQRQILFIRLLSCDPGGDPTGAAGRGLRGPAAARRCFPLRRQEPWPRNAGVER